MNGQKHKTGLMIFVPILCLLLITATGITYAWFSSNSVVNTDRVTGRTNSQQAELLISESGGGAFHGNAEAAMVQVNRTALTELMPVSTADLMNFVYNDATVENTASYFERVEEEKYYYHGRFYLMASMQNQPENTRVQLYFDLPAENGNVFLRNMSGSMANAARLGMTFDGGGARFFRFGDSENPGSERVNNTMVNGVLLSDGQVLDSSGGSIRAVADPSVPVESCMISQDGLAGTATPLLSMEPNRIYEVDVYFYLEGCDPDCTDSIQQNDGELYLAFYGLLTTEG